MKIYFEKTQVWLNTKTVTAGWFCPLAIGFVKLGDECMYRYRVDIEVFIVRVTLCLFKRRK